VTNKRIYDIYRGLLLFGHILGPGYTVILKGNGIVMFNPKKFPEDAYYIKYGVKNGQQDKYHIFRDANAED
jgi:hypothetical protein